MENVVQRVVREYPHCKHTNDAVLVSACASTGQHAAHIMAYHLGMRRSKELNVTLNVKKEAIAMNFEELAILFGCSRQASESPKLVSVLKSNPFVSRIVDDVENALVVTMESDQAKRMWRMPSVKAVIAFSVYIDIPQIMIEKLLGNLCRSDLRKLEVLSDDVHTAMETSDGHLSALNALVGAFVESIDTKRHIEA
jgi:hypothetical protein